MLLPCLNPALRSRATTAARGKIFLLMLADDRIELEQIWVNFLAPAVHGVDYRVFLHCQNPSLCLQNVKRRDLFTMVPMVPSRYCSDLLGPELALLSAAVHHSDPGNLDDKFVLVSHNSVPVKPWPVAHRILTENLAGKASFNMAKGGQGCGLTWHTQWWSLSYWQAERMLAAQEPRLNCSVASCLPDVPKGCAKCMDAVWPIVSIYGLAELRNESRYPDSLVNKRVMWLDWHTKHIGKDYAQGKIRKAGHEGPWGPAQVDVVSQEFLAFLAGEYQEGAFARKFTRNTRFSGGMSLVEAFDKYVFNTA